MSTPTFVYFPVGATGESIRQLLAHAKVKYIDERIMPADWPARKPLAMGNSLPNWIENGQTMNESQAILRYLGHKHGYYPKDELAAWKADCIVGKIQPLYPKINPTFMFGKPDDAHFDLYIKVW